MTDEMYEEMLSDVWDVAAEASPPGTYRPAVTKIVMGAAAGLAGMAMAYFYRWVDERKDAAIVPFDVDR